MSIDDFLANRVRQLRKNGNLSLDALAQLSGVSRSTISLIERGETSATAAVLNKLSDALGMTLSALFADEPKSSPTPLSRRFDQPVWRDPGSGYEQRQVSPRGLPLPFELIEVVFPPGQTVTFDTVERRVAAHQQVWMLDGEMTVTCGDSAFNLSSGDCLALDLGQHISFHNPAGSAARYAIALATTSAPKRKP